MEVLWPIEKNHGEYAMKNIWVNGMMGVVVGDALGMPVQFIERC